MAQQYFTDMENLYNAIDTDDCSLYKQMFSFEDRVNNIALEIRFAEIAISKQLVSQEVRSQRSRARFQIAQIVKA